MTNNTTTTNYNPAHLRSCLLTLDMVDAEDVIQFDDQSICLRIGDNAQTVTFNWSAHYRSRTEQIAAMLDQADTFTIVASPGEDPDGPWAVWTFLTCEAE